MKQKYITNFQVLKKIKKKKIKSVRDDQRYKEKVLPNTHSFISSAHFPFLLGKNKNEKILEKKNSLN